MRVSNQTVAPAQLSANVMYRLALSLDLIIFKWFPYLQNVLGHLVCQGCYKPLQVTRY